MIYMCRYVIIYTSDNEWIVSATTICTQISIIYIHICSFPLPYNIHAFFNKVDFTMKKKHYLLLDFCYWANLAVLVYVWLRPLDYKLFQIIFMLSNGPLGKEPFVCLYICIYMCMYLCRCLYEYRLYLYVFMYVCILSLMSGMVLTIHTHAHTYTHTYTHV